MRTLFMTAVAAALWGTLSISAAAQTPADSTTPGTPIGGYHISVEGYLAQYSIASSAFSSDRVGVGGFGARVMFNRGGAREALQTIFDRARAGAFITYTAKQNNFTTWHVGGQADVSLFQTPMDGWFDPFVSLGAGIFRFSQGAGGGTTRSSNDFALSPAVGTLIPIMGPLSFRGDLRDVIVFGDKTLNNFVAEGGLSYTF